MSGELLFRYFERTRFFVFFAAVFACLLACRWNRTMPSAAHLPPTDLPARSICLILNDRAVEDSRLHDAVAEARSRGFFVDLRPITFAGEALSLGYDAAVEGFGRIVAAGGDGTVNEVLNGICQAGEKFSGAMGVLPFGTANDFASAVHVPLNDPAAALSEIIETPATPIDVARVNHRYYLNVACGGFGAETTTQTPDNMKAQLGRFAYFITGIQRMPSITANPMHIRAPGFEFSGPTFALIAANGRQTGGGIQVAPRAVLDDGKLDLLVVPNVPWSDLMAVIAELMHIGLDFDFEHVEYRQVPWIEAETEHTLQVNVDGEPITGRRFRFEVLPRRLPFFLPRRRPS